MKLGTMRRYAEIEPGFGQSVQRCLVRTAGLEPAPRYREQILSLLRLPFRHVRVANPPPAPRSVRRPGCG